MKKWLGTLVAVLLLQGASARAELVDRVAAVVNRDIITQSEVEKRAAPGDYGKYRKCWAAEKPSSIN